MWAAEPWWSGWRAGRAGWPRARRCAQAVPVPACQRRRPPGWVVGRGRARGGGLACPTASRSACPAPPPDLSPGLRVPSAHSEASPCQAAAQPAAAAPQPRAEGGVARRGVRRTANRRLARAAKARAAHGAQRGLEGPLVPADCWGVVGGTGESPKAGSCASRSCRGCLQQAPPHTDASRGAQHSPRACGRAGAFRAGRRTP